MVKLYFESFSVVLEMPYNIRITAIAVIQIMSFLGFPYSMKIEKSL